MPKTRHPLRRTPPVVVLAIALATAATVASPTPVVADGGVDFQDFARNPASGITYRRAPSLANEKFDAIKLDPPYDQAKRLDTPIKARGAPGVALLDYDGDGDLDIYVTNGPGADNPLYSNQLMETGSVSFVDVAAAAGVAATDHDSTGVCFGDIDNDGDHDLLVVGIVDPDRLFENNGNGTFRDISTASGIASSGVHVSSGCSMGDVNGDGLLDLSISNTFDNWNTFRGVLEDPFLFNQHNQLWVNRGGNRFVAAGPESGIQDLAGFPPEAAGSAGLSWAAALVDIDQDGDVDYMTADDQGGIPPARTGGVDRGLLHLFENDGSGHFTDVSVEAGTNHFGSWMGLSFGDYDCNGTIDFFGSNFGDYQPVGIPEPGREASRWYLNNGDGTFEDPGVGDLVTTPFGWGTSTGDYDNDGDLDVVFHGGHDVGPGIEAGNPGVILQNRGCSADFWPDFDALAGSTNHNRRTVHGMALGDLDNNGFLDIVSVSNLDIPESIPLLSQRPLGSPFDATAFFVLTFEPNDLGELVWNGYEYEDGTLAVELSDGANGNGWVDVMTRGSVDLTRGGRVNRDGIGAVVRFLPDGGRWVTQPVVGGSSYASQDALAAHFGLGEAPKGLVEVLWPGGVRNRLYNVHAGERIVFPEIPCSFDAFDTQWGYVACLTKSLDDLVDAGVIGQYERVRLLMSALRARASTLPPVCSQADDLWDEEEALFRDLAVLE